MTLFTSDTKPNRTSIWKSIIVYICVTLFVLVFGSVYEYFGHGIFSFYMQYAFLFPLVLGIILPLLISILFKKKSPDYKPGVVYNYGIAVLTMGSVIKGVLDIYGTSSDLIIPYFVVGPLMLIYGLVKPLIAKKSVTD